MGRIPGIPYGPAPKAAGYASALSQPPKIIVVHCTSNTAPASGEASYAASRTDARGNWTSAHAYVDANGPLGSLDLGLQAWAAFGWANARGWHIELCGRENAVPDAVQRAGAALVRQLCQLAGIPMEHLDGAAIRALHDGSRTRGGVTGHYDITRSGIDGNDHTDPGTSFNWDRFMSWVTSGDAPTGGIDMGDIDQPIGAGNTPGGQAYGQYSARVGIGYTWYRTDEIKGQLAQVLANQAADAARDAAVKAAVDGLVTVIQDGGGDVDVVALKAAMADAAHDAVAPLQEEIADLRHRLALAEQAAGNAAAAAIDG